MSNLVGPGLRNSAARATGRVRFPSRWAVGPSAVALQARQSRGAAGEVPHEPPNRPQHIVRQLRRAALAASHPDLGPSPHVISRPAAHRPTPQPTRARNPSPYIPRPPRYRLRLAAYLQRWVPSDAATSPGTPPGLSASGSTRLDCHCCLQVGSGRSTDAADGPVPAPRGAVRQHRKELRIQATTSPHSADLHQWWISNVKNGTATPATAASAASPPD